MISFSLFSFLIWAFLSTFLPGAILSYSIFRKEEGFGLLEKILIGFALGFVLLPLIPFLLYLIAGIKYTYGLALISVAALYLIAIALFIRNKAYEDLIPKDMKISFSPSILIPIILAIILVVSYLVRIGSYSPIFQELDPYYYTYCAHQLMTLGENPINDTTAWYPEEIVSHRTVPQISYLESVWYSMYSQGGQYDNMHLAVIASMYPPLAAVLSIFFIYLLVSSLTKREWGIIAAGLAAFAPVFIYKLSAGEQEVQPYAFFALFFFYAFYALSMKRKDLRIPTMSNLNPGKDAIFPIIAGLAFASLALGSASQVLAIASLVIFVTARAILLFLRDDDEKELSHLLISNAIIFLIGPLIFSSIFKAIFETGSPSFSIAIAYLIPVAFTGLLYLIKSKIRDRMLGAMMLCAILILGVALYAATPLGSYIKNVGKSGFEIAKYNAPLDRTIAEQGTASGEFTSQIGFIAQHFTPPAILDAQSALGALLYVILFPFSLISNIILGLSVALINLILGTDVAYSQSAVSLLHLWLVLFWAAAVYGAYRFIKKEGGMSFLLMLAIVMPPLIVGLIKAKYTIYSGALIAVAIGYSLGQAGGMIQKLFKNIKEEDLGKAAYIAPLLLGAFLVLLQFLSQGFAPSLLVHSMDPLYQNDPMALEAKFQQFCNESSDAELCAAAADPKGFAGKDTNFQYSSKLCMLSVFSNYSYYSYLTDNDPIHDELIPADQYSAASFRCQRVSDYWIDSMEWIRDNTAEGSRITSWWDYGHWINYFGLRNAVIRNEHASHKMIGDVAHGYTDASPQELKEWMKAHGSEYALFDVELLYGGGSLGGKYGALNYLSCARDNLTSVDNSPGESDCEAQHLWETIFVTGNPCTISTLSGRTGLTAYKMYAGGQYIPYYPSFCIAPSDPKIVSYCQQAVRAAPAYCVGNVTLASGETTYGTYYLNETYPNGDLKLNKATIELPYPLQTTSHFGAATGVTLFYTHDKIWLENGEIKSGYEDRKGKFYDSTLYQAIFLNDLPGFKLAYETPGGSVKIYKIE